MKGDGSWREKYNRPFMDLRSLRAKNNPTAFIITQSRCQRDCVMLTWEEVTHMTSFRCFAHQMLNYSKFNTVQRLSPQEIHKQKNGKPWVESSNQLKIPFRGKSRVLSVRLPDRKYVGHAGYQIGRSAMKESKLKKYTYFWSNNNF